MSNTSGFVLGELGYTDRSRAACIQPAKRHACVSVSFKISRATELNSKAGIVDDAGNSCNAQWPPCSRRHVQVP